MLEYKGYNFQTIKRLQVTQGAILKIKIMFKSWSYLPEDTGSSLQTSVRV